jgi:hypothetical protein
VISCQVEITGNAQSRAGKPREGFLRYRDWLNGLLEPGEIAAERFVESPVVHPSVLMRRAALEAAGGWREVPWAEDYDLWLRLLQAGKRFAKVPEILFTWRDGADRLTRVDGRYAPRNFTRAKAHYLAQMPAVRERGVEISGAGPTGRAIARELRAEGITLRAFYEVSPKLIGRERQGAPVRSYEDLPAASADCPVHLAAVARPAGKQRLRGLLQQAGYRRGENWFAVA